MRTWFRSLSGFVDQDRAEFDLRKTRVTGAHTRAADNISRIKYLLLALPNERLVLPFVVAAKLALFVLELNQLLKLDVRGVVGDLAVEREEGDGRVEGFAGFRSEANNLEAGSMDLLRELIHRDVRRSADEDLARIHLCEMIDDRRRGDGLSGTGRALDQTERLL